MLGLVGFFLLPVEAAYRLENGVIVKFAGRGLVLAFLLVPQFIFTLLAAGIVWGMVWFSGRLEAAGNTAAHGLLSIIGNMVVMPQVVLVFAMLYILGYNLPGIQLPPFWVVAVGVVGLGTVILIRSFTRAINRAKQA
ncbi:hypothetical protein ACFLTW_00520 [Chloroflexota bacterium]